MSERRPRSTHDLPTIQSLVAAGSYRIAEDPSEFSSLGLDETDVRDAIAQLTPAHARKTMPSLQRPGRMQDVYLLRYCGFPLYIKFDLIRDTRSEEPRVVIILSFKRDSSQ